MAPAGRQLRKKKDIHYRIPPPPRLPSDPKKSAKPVSSKEDQSAAGAADMAVSDDSIFADSQISQESDVDFTFPVPTFPFKRARSATVVGDDMVVPSSSPKRHRIRDPSQLPTPTTSSSLQQKGKARSTLSPATEAAFQQMPQEIEKAITSLKSIKNIVEGLLEFKAILDLEAARVLPDVRRRQATGSQWTID
ncbi:hypothetical protein EPUS_00612 [Endocarpon pusillum Z07020]|uniref:Uncharacterized protein n=1 Tax=Endocarpon pusillum (strain Z07020 / HMAS-L-300199) TaxID=1263415 RepID=U1GHQ3_ENDPU|nr:uncharacterized protein EPUS_00612 [Endocarpon pusillum Z07020]ERF71623.1 hypothetical protein EPUS_00612 [Endocarpon pusillum Z07020]